MLRHYLLLFVKRFEEPFRPFRHVAYNRNNNDGLLHSTREQPTRKCSTQRHTTAIDHVIICRLIAYMHPASTSDGVSAERGWMPLKPPRTHEKSSRSSSSHSYSTRTDPFSHHTAGSGNAQLTHGSSGKSGQDSITTLRSIRSDVMVNYLINKPCQSHTSPHWTYGKESS